MQVPDFEQNGISWGKSESEYFLNRKKNHRN